MEFAICTFSNLLQKILKHHGRLKLKYFIFFLGLCIFHIITWHPSSKNSYRYHNWNILLLPFLKPTWPIECYLQMEKKLLKYSRQTPQKTRRFIIFFGNMPPVSAVMKCSNRHIPRHLSIDPQNSYYLPTSCNDFKENLKHGLKMCFKTCFFLAVKPEHSYTPASFHLPRVIPYNLLEVNAM